MAPVVRGNSLYNIVDGPSWTQAEANSVKLGGHLTAITNIDENKWITDTFDSLITTDEGLWIGLSFDKATSKWNWSASQSFDYNSWYPGEPSRTLQNDGVTREDSVHIYLTNQDGSGYHGRRGYWNDIPFNAPNAPEGRGISETPFIRRGDSAYVIVQGPTWEEAESNAVKLGGHLVTINDKEENEWLHEFTNIQTIPQHDVQSTRFFWTGLNDVIVEGQYKWSSGEPLVYTNWAGGEPSNGLNSTQGEDFIHLGWAPNKQWNDFPSQGIIGAYTNHLSRHLGIAEIKLAPNNTPTGTPTVTGTLKVGSTLTIDATAIKDSDNFTGYTPTLKYNWETSTDGTTWSKLTSTDGADNNNTYILASTETNKKIRGVVSYLDGYGTNEAVNSAASTIEAVTSTYTLTPSSATINEGAVLTSTVTTTNIATGTKFYYALSGTGITTADFSAGALTGEGATDSAGKFSFTHTLANDLATEGAETVEIKLFSDVARKVQVGSTATVTVKDTSIPVIRGNSLYTIVDGYYWHESEELSRKRGGNLVTINSSEENSFIYSSFGALAVELANTRNQNSSKTNLHIGLNDQEREGLWAWSSGQKVEYTNWHPGEPGNGTEGNHVGIFVNWGSNGKWHDLYDNYTRGDEANIGISETPFIRRGDSAYVIVQGPTWEEAEANAVKLGGHLVTINDKEENEWLHEFTNIQTIPQHDVQSTRFFWTGLNDVIVEGQYKWSSGEPLVYTNWAGGEPSNGLNSTQGEDFIHLGWAPNKQWNDFPSQGIIGAYTNHLSRHLGIAEIKLAPNNTPTGTPTVTGTLKVGSTLTIDATAIKDSDNFTGYTPTLKYNWETSTDGTTWSKLTSTDGADNNNTYILTATETNKKIRGVVSYLDGYGTNEVVNSSASTIELATPTYTLTPSTATINEGAVLTSTVTTTNIATGTKLYYALSGTGINAADFSAGALTGEGTTDSAGKFSFTHTLANDLTTEGVETVEIKLFSDVARKVQVGSTASVSIVDTSIPIVRGNSLYNIVDGPSWTQAEANSVKLGGHLVTINSEQENAFLVNNFAKSVSYNGVKGDSSGNGQYTPRAWIGLNDKDVEGVYKWTSGEEVSYMGRNWFSGMSKTSGHFDPNTGYVSEALPLIYEFIDQDAVNIQLGSDGSTANIGIWDDVWGNYSHFQDGITETPFIRRGDSAYVIVQGPTWEEAESNAVKLGGHLVTINDAAENQWLASQFSDSFAVPDNYWGGMRSGAWIGLNDREQDGNPRWVNGENISFTNYGIDGQSTGLPGQTDGWILLMLDPSGEAQRRGGLGTWWSNAAEKNPSSPNWAYKYGIAEIKLAPNNTPTGTPTVTGTLKVGSTLTIDATAIKDSDNFTGYTPTLKYNWETSTDGTTWSKLTSTDGADNNNTYILTATEANKKIRGVVNYLDGYGANEVVNSAAVDLKGLISAEPIKSWTRLLGTSSSDSASSISTGSDGSIYIAGITYGNLDGNSNAGNGDAFLSKYKSDGTKSWARLLGTTDIDQATSVTTGSDGSIYIAGMTEGNLDGIVGEYDAFLSKYNSDGTKSWTRLLGSSGREYANSVTTGRDGSIYIAGTTYGNLDGNSNAGNGDAFLSKYNSDGTKYWTRLLGNVGYDYATSVTTSSEGSIYIAGYAGGHLDGINNGSGDGDAFLSKYNSDGTKSWTRLLGSSAYDYATSVSTSSDESIYISGYTYGNLDGNSNAGNGDAFLSKYNSDGTKSWARLLGSDREDLAKSVTTGSDGSIYIAGYTNGNLDGNSNNGVNDAFLSKYNSDGTKSWTRLLGSSGGEYANSITMGSDGSIYIAGYTNGNLDGNSNNGVNDAFLSKFSFTHTYALNPSTTSINEGSALTTSVATTNILSGTTFYYSLSGTGITTADFSAGALTGEGTTDSAGKFSFTHTLANDLTTEGAETVSIKLYSDTARTLQVGSTASVSVVDSSTTAPLVVRGNSLYTIVDGPSWTQAEANSVKLGGHLVTINSEENNQFLYREFLLGKADDNRWIGLTDNRLEGIWTWTSGEISSYRNWATQTNPPQPDNLEGKQHYAYFWDDFSGYWDDAPDLGADITTGIAETPFIRRGDSAYVIVQGPTWEEAESNAVKLGGHLVTINDKGENEWISTVMRTEIQNRYSLKYGYGVDSDRAEEWRYNPLIAYSDKVAEGKWTWADSSLSNYTNWFPGEPNASTSNSDYAVMYFYGIRWNSEPLIGSWDDTSGGTIGIAEIKLAPNNTPTGTPTVTGTLKVGSTLTIDATAIKDSDNFTGYTPTLKYNWETSTDGTTWSKLTSTDAADNNNTYILTATEANKKLRGVVSYLDGYGTNEVVNSAASTIESVNPSYTLTPSSATINEGAVLTSTVTTTNVATGTKLYYALSGTGITTADFSAGTITGEGTTDSAGKFSFTHTLANDLATEGAETVEIKLFSDVARKVQVGSTASITVKDTSIPVVRGNSLYNIVDGPSWTQAEANSVKLGGHLVAINDVAENLFIQDKIKSTRGEFAGNAWIGLSDVEQEGKWVWASKEANGYTNWNLSGNEPNGGTSENYAMIYLEYLKIGTEAEKQIGKWNDANGTGKVGGGIAETPFIRRGDSAYVIVQGPTWEEAEANALKLGGHLVTINDAAENDYLFDWLLKDNVVTDSYGNAFNGDSNLYLTGFTNKDPEGTWKWISGEPVTYTNWQYAQPDNLNNEDYMHLGWFGGNQWNDISNSPDLFSYTYGIAEIKLAPNNTPTETPSVTGTLKVGSTLTIDATAIKDSDNFTGYTPTFKYNWETSTDGTTWSKLTSTDAADNNNTYILTAAEANKKIRGVVSYLDGYGSQESVATTSSVPITSSAPPVQSLTLTPPSKSAVRSGVSTTSAISYNVSTGETALTGIEASLYFDSTQLTLNTAGDPFKTGLLGNAITADTTNADGDPKTDKVLSLIYADFGGNFPGSGTTLPLTLANLNLVPTSAYSGTTLHLQGTPAVGYTATGADLTLTYNAAPTVTGILTSQTINRGSAFTYTVPSALFTDPDSTLTISAKTSTGAALPSWLSFNATTGTFTGTPTAAGTFNLAVAAADELGSVFAPLSLNVREIQSVSSSATDIRYQRNKDVTVPINYNTSDGSQTTGLSFKVHYNSALFSFDPLTGVSNKATADLFQIGAVQSDTSDNDADANTDKFIPINVASFSGSFPSGATPIKLADLIFTAADKLVDPLTGLKVTKINFSITEAAQGYGFQGTGASLKPMSFSLDVDGDGKVTALGDGLMVIRKLFGAAFAGDALTSKAISPTATRSTAEIHDFIQQGIDGGLLDVDKDGKTTALGDGLMVIRRLFGAAFAGTALIDKAISPSSPYLGGLSYATMTADQKLAASGLVSANIDALKSILV